MIDIHTKWNNLSLSIPPIPANLMATLHLNLINQCSYRLAKKAEDFHSNS